MAAAYGTAAQLSTVSIGMTKAEVIQHIGSPRFVATDGKVEFLEYQWVDGVMSFPNLPKEYYVAIRNGLVISYGRKGDFNTTKNPTRDLNIHQDVDVSSRVPPPGANGTVDLADELKKLFELKKSGAISEQDYREEKDKLLGH
jgi:hypothetical protein